MPQERIPYSLVDVAAQIIPTTVHIKSLSDAQALQVLEQNYEYDLLNPEKLLEKYVGKEVKIFDKNYYTGKDEIAVATLLSTNNGFVYQINNEIHINPPGRVILPQVPENLIAKPTLVWFLRASRAGKQKIEASYLTNQITWQADYVTVLNLDDTKADLTGWVTIDNKSGSHLSKCHVETRCWRCSSPHAPTNVWQNHGDGSPRPGRTSPVQRRSLL